MKHKIRIPFPCEECIGYAACKHKMQIECDKLFTFVQFPENAGMAEERLPKMEMIHQSPKTLEPIRWHSFKICHDGVTQWLTAPRGK